MLIVFSGLPGVGKTTIAMALAREIEAVYLRIDIIEQALRDSEITSRPADARGYRIANALAASNLCLGKNVVVDGVNPVAKSREAFAQTAKSSATDLVNIEIICTDRQEHRRRVETRQSDIAGLIPPTWQSVLTHEYQTWAQPTLILDSALISTKDAVATLIERMNQRGASSRGASNVDNHLSN